MIKVKTVELRKNLQHYIDLVLSGEDVILEYKGGVEIRLQPNEPQDNKLTQAQKILAYFDSPEYKKKIEKTGGFKNIPEDPQKLKEFIIEHRYQDYLKLSPQAATNEVRESKSRYEIQTGFNSVLLDTNIVVDLINKGSREQNVKKALAEFDELFVTTSTYLTVFYVLRKFDLSLDTIRNALFQYKLVEIAPRICYHAANLAKSIDDVEDCALLLTAQENRSVLVTADKELVKKYGHVHSCLLVE